MEAHSLTTPPPITAQDVTPEWIAACKEAMSQHEGVPVRANPLTPSIDAFSINRKRWIPLTLPGSGTLFATFDDRNAVLGRLQSK